MYERYAILRDKCGLSDYSIAKNIGIGRSTLSDWKTGKHIPNRDNLKKIADYFGVSINYLLGDEDVYYENPETAEIAQKLFENKEMRALFDAAQDATPEDLMTAYNVLLALKKKEHPDD